MALRDVLSGIFRRRTAPSTAQGVGGAVTYNGFLVTNEANSRMTGQERYKEFSRILANVSIVATGVRFFLNLVSKAGWKVEPSEEPGGEEYAEFVEAVMKETETPWFRVVRRAAMFKFYGFSIQEMIAAKRPDGRNGIGDVEARPQRTIERWDLDESGKVAGAVQRHPKTSEELYLDRERMLYLVDDSLDDSPEGLGLFRHLVEPARRLARYEELEGWGYETDLRGIPVGRVPYALLNSLVKNGKIDKKTAESMKKPLEDFIKGHIKSPQLGLILDSITYESTDEASTPSGQKQWDIDLLKAGSTSQEAVAATIERINRELARILGIEHLLLGESGSGSLAMSKDKSANFALTVDSALLELTSSFEHDFVRYLGRLNGQPREMDPKLKTDRIQHREVTEITQALKDMAASGAILAPNDPAIEEVRDLLGLSKPEVIEVGDPGMNLGAGKPDPEEELDDPEDEAEVDELEEEES